jgi:formylglycine-generating enzyme required for sulfatase activity
MQKLKRICNYFLAIIFISAAFNTVCAQKNISPKKMTLIPAGYFNLGSADGFDDEYPIVKVWIDSFYIDNHEVTNKEYKAFCDSTKRTYPPNPMGDTSYFSRKTEYPVVNVTWDDAAAYAKWAGKRLPTEAEWEKAARGGSDSKYFCGDSITGNDANYSGKHGTDKWNKASPVESFPPNKFGIYDMIGNVWEWCNDFYQKEYYFSITSPNPAGPKTSAVKVIRGGSWDSAPEILRSAQRGKLDPKLKNSNVGFRCAVSVGNR